jgi:hypothetical protein
MSNRSFQAESGKVPETALSVSERTSVCPTDVTVKDRTNTLLEGITDVLEHHGVASVVRVALNLQVHDYLDSSKDETVWGKKAKSLLTYPLALYLRNEPPAEPDCGYFKPSGLVRRWMKSRMINYCRKNTHLWYSWLQCKKCTLDSSEEIVDQAYADHRKVLTSIDDGDDEVIESIFQDQTFINHLNSIREGLTQFYVNDKDFYEYQPSTSASFGSTRGNQGAYGELCSLVGRSDDIYTDDLISMKYLPFSNGRSCHQVKEIRSVSTSLGDDWKECLESQFFKRTQEMLSAKIQGIVEPMKVRVISKGPAFEYYAAKPLQKALHTVLRNMSCYKLIGRPLCPTDLIDIKSKALPDWEWFSVDYKGATDGLSWKYSGRILKYIIQDLSPRYQALALDVLGPHKLVYPNSARIESGKMEKGQLMGSILSFPILCIANYGLYLNVTKELHQGWSDEERQNHCLINGDDQVYAAPVHLWTDHIEKGKKVGLEMTVGKAYHHPRYANANSTSIDCPMGSIHPYQVTYLNTGLLRGISKVRSQTDTLIKEKNVVELLPKVLLGSLPGRQCQLLKKWFSIHSSETINNCTKIRLGRRDYLYRSIFMPQSLGGMGVDAPLGWRHYRSKRHILYASTFAIKMHLSSQIPLPGYELKDLSLFREVPYFKAPDFPVEAQSVIGKSYIKTLRECNYPIYAYCPHRYGYSLS